MFTHPAITQALASQHRRDLITQADTYRLARAARGDNPTRPSLFRMGRRPVNLAQSAKRAVTATAAAAAAAAVLMTPAGATTTQHASAHVFSVPSWSHSADGQLGGRWA